jgi:hypothetical protein
MHAPVETSENMNALALPKTQPGIPTRQERSPTVSGSLADFPFAQLLAVIHRRGLSGTLVITPGEGQASERRVVFSDGIPVAAELPAGHADLASGLLSFFLSQNRYAFFENVDLGVDGALTHGVVDPASLIMEATTWHTNDDAVDAMLQQVGSEALLYLTSQAQGQDFTRWPEACALVAMVSQGPLSLAQLISGARREAAALKRVVYAFLVLGYLAPSCSLTTDMNTKSAASTSVPPPQRKKRARKDSHVRIRPSRKARTSDSHEDRFANISDLVIIDPGSDPPEAVLNGWVREPAPSKKHAPPATPSEMEVLSCPIAEDPMSYGDHGDLPCADPAEAVLPDFENVEVVPNERAREPATSSSQAPPASLPRMEVLSCPVAEDPMNYGNQGVQDSDSSMDIDIEIDDRDWRGQLDDPRSPVPAPTPNIGSGGATRGARPRPKPKPSPAPRQKRQSKVAAQVGFKDARRLMIAGRFSQAACRLTAVTRLDPSVAGYHAELAYCLLHQSSRVNPHRILESAERALRLDKWSDRGHLCKGLALELLGRTDEACSYLRWALELNSDTDEAEQALRRITKPVGPLRVLFRKFVS